MLNNAGEMYMEIRTQKNKISLPRNSETHYSLFGVLPNNTTCEE